MNLVTLINYRCLTRWIHSPLDSERRNLAPWKGPNLIYINVLERVWKFLSNEPKTTFWIIPRKALTSLKKKKKYLNFLRIFNFSKITKGLVDEATLFNSDNIKRNKQDFYEWRWFTKFRFQLEKSKSWTSKSFRYNKMYW